MGAIEQKFVGDSAGLEKAYEKILRANNQLLQEVQRLREESKKGAGEQQQQLSGVESFARGALGQVTSLVTQYASLHGVLGLVNTSLEKQRELNRDIFAAQRTVATAEAEVVKNLSRDALKDRKQILAEIKVMSTEAGMPSAAATMHAVAAALPAVGNDPAKAISAVRWAAPLMRDQPEKIADFAAAQGVLSTQLGMDEKTAAAFLISAHGESLMRQYDQLKNMIPAIATVVAASPGTDKIESTRHAMAAFAAISTAAGDTEGAQTKTAVASMATKLDRIFPEKDILDAHGEVIRAGTGKKTFDERLQALQADKTEQAVFLEGLRGEVEKGGFRAGMMGVIRQFITDSDSPVSNRYRESLGRITPDVSRVDELLAALKDSSPELALTAAAQKSEGIIESTKVGRNLGAIEQARKTLEEGLKSTRTGNWDWLAESGEMKLFDWEASRSPAQARFFAQASLARRARDIYRSAVTAQGGPVSAEQRQALDEFEDSPLAGLSHLGSAQLTKDVQSSEMRELIIHLRELVTAIRESGREPPPAAAPAAAEVGRHSER